MSMFNRSGGGAVRNYHSYITEHVTLHNIGLASYTRNTLDNFGMERKDGKKTLSREIDEYFDGQFSSLKPKLLGDSVTLSMFRFDQETKRYFLTTDQEIWSTPSGDAASSLTNFQERFDLWQKGFITDDAEKYKLNYVWSNIQTSLSGCITFDVDYTVLTCDAKSLVRLYFQSGGKASAERTIADSAGGMFAGVPSRATGGQYAYTPTQNSAPGVYAAPAQGGDNNADNTVAAPMRMTYDPATNRWESGTQQMLFRLLTDIDGVSIPDLPQSVDNTDLEEFYSGPLSSSFTVGTGMPVSIENGNPHLFGPNSYGCGPSPKEKVIMVNRTPRSYAAGEIVIGSLINGEWIPMGFGPARTVSKKFNVEWSNIQKYIVNASAYFRDQPDNNDVTPEKYLNHVRFKFYQDMIIEPVFDLSQRLKTLNLLNKPVDSYELLNWQLQIPETPIAEIPGFFVNTNLIPNSDGYWQFFDADVIKPNLCGNNQYSRLKKTNIKQTEFKDYPDTNDVDPLRVTSSWGMYFPDGYTSSSVAKLKNATTGRSFINTIAPDLAVYNAQSLINFSAEANNTLFLGDFFGTSFDVSDSNLYHFPAQMALNASGNQTIISNALWFAQKKAGNYATNLITYLHDAYKGDFVVNPFNKDVFGLKPVNPTIVQFTPLSLQLALCSTSVIPNTQEATLFANQGGYRDLNLSLTSQLWDYKAFGKAWQRLSSIIGQPIDQNNLLIPNGNVRGAIPFGRILRKFGANTSFSAPNRFEKPDGGPGLIPFVGGDEISNVNGIIAARATVNLPAGGQLELRTSNNFGLNAYGVVTGRDGGTSFTGAGFFGLIPTSNGGQTKVFDYVQWGASSTDDIRAFGTTALWCKITDHCPDTIYDGRYFTPLQFNPSGASVDLDEFYGKEDNGGTEQKLRAGFYIQQRLKDYKVFTKKENIVRRDQLLSGGGFYYIKRAIGVAPFAIEILDEDPDDPQSGYSDGEEVTFSAKMPARFKVTRTDENGKILTIEPDFEKYGQDAYGEFSGNPFYGNGKPLEGKVTTTKGRGVKIHAKTCMIYEKLGHDVIQDYGTKRLTPPDNDGGGDSNGYVKSSRSTTYSLSTNKTGKYDIFLFFVNDIMNYPENSNGANPQMNGPYGQYVNLEITAN